MKIDAPGGFGVVSKVVMHHPDLSRHAKVLYATLTTYADYRTRFCWPGEQRLATALGCSPKHVRTGLAELVAAGVIVRERRSGSSSGTTLQDFVCIDTDST